MSLLNYLKKADMNSRLINACESMNNDNNLPINVSAGELEKVKESLKLVEVLKYKREKQEVAKYVIMSGATAVIRKFVKSSHI